MAILASVACPQFVIRPARPEDVPRLRELFRDAVWSNRADRPLLAAHPEFLDWCPRPALDGRTSVAEVAGQVVGFVSRDAAEIEDLFVDPGWMRRGIGTALIEHARAEARRAGHRHLRVEANAHALEFYARAGFVVEHEVSLEHGTAIRMRLGRRS